jgi:hypothetical protein
MSPHFAIAVCAGALVWGGCSLVVGDELPLSCTQPSDCDALNKAENLDLDTVCVVYQCRSDGHGCQKRAQDLDGDGAFAPACEGTVEGPFDCDDSPNDGASRTPGRDDECDGKDNDCDGVIDNGAFSRSPPADAEGGIGQQEVVHVSHAGRDGQSRLAVTSKDGTEFTTSILLYDPLHPWPSFDGGQVAASRVTASSAVDCGDRQCMFLELALATGPDVLLALGVNERGCGTGEMRAGGAGSRFKPDIGSLRWATSVSNCSGDNSDGASRASLGVIAVKGSVQGLALWRATPATSQAAAPLVGNGLWIGTRGRDHPEIQGTTGVTAHNLADSNGHDAPAVGGWVGTDRAGYFVAYDTAETVEIAFVPQLAAPTAQAMNDWLRAPPLREAAPREVSLAVGDSGLDRPVGLAAAWRTEREVRFARISFDGGASPTLAAEPPETLQSDAEIVDGPKVVYIPQGLAEDSDGDTGGWFITWMEHDGPNTRVLGVRIPEKVTGRESREDPFEIFRGDRLGRLFAYPASASKPGYGFVETKEGQQTLHIGSLACPLSQD